MVLTAIAREALILSIAKWQAIVDGTGVDRGTTNCALCKAFYGAEDELSDRCIGCPVLEKTGVDSCVNTPYTDWAMHQHAHLLHDPPRRVRDGCTLCLQTAKAELNFLKNLLSESEEQK